jgi:hypothetical protein
MAAEYKQTSAYYDTSTRGNYLDVLTYRPIPKNGTDIPYIIDRVYEYRPDLLANDLYGDSSLWWVFAVRNPNTISDPIYDFAAGTTIYLPSKDVITASLGI